MGSYHSVPILVGEDRRKRKVIGKRNKLTKPRTNSSSTSTKCFPPFSLRSSKSKPSVSRIHGSLKTPPTTRDILLLSRDEATVTATKTPNYARRDGYVAGRLARHTKYRGGDRNSLTQTASEGSATGHVSDSYGSDFPTTVGDLSMPLRRRSTLRAAPPATISRISTENGRTTSIVSSENEGIPLLLIPAALEDRQGSTTPSGYSVLGNFKRGSLRIVNGCPSPYPPSDTGSPPPTPNRDGSALRTHTSAIGEAYVSLERCTPGLNGEPHSRDDRSSSGPGRRPSPESPAGPRETPDRHEDDDVCEEVSTHIPVSSSSRIPRHNSSSAPESTEDLTSRVSRRANSNSVFYELTGAAYSDLQVSCVNTAPSDSTALLEGSIYAAIDSGYNSTESRTSFQSSSPQPDGTERTASITTTNSSTGSYTCQPDRSETTPPLQGGIFGLAAPNKNWPSYPFRPSCSISFASVERPAQSRLKKRTPVSADEYINLLDPFPVSRQSSYSCSMRRVKETVEVPGMITGQTYYQRFLKRQSQPVQEEYYSQIEERWGR
jgi:hypothetical protein